jgi:hypothetical protein
MATIKPGLNPATLSIAADSLGGPGPIAFDASNLDPYESKYRDVIDYIRLRLGDGIVDVELDQEHYELAIKQAFNKYRQRSSNAVEESYAFLNLLPETQEYILPREVITVKQIFRRGIGSVTGTTASQFEPFASGYLNTYMLVAGRVGGLTNYELFVQYQEQTMKMFGGYMNFSWNTATKKLTLVRKIPDAGKNYIRLTSLTANGTAPGSTITLVTEDIWNVGVGDSMIIANCRVAGYNGNYQIQTVDQANKTVTVVAHNVLAATSVVTFDLRSTQVWSPVTDIPAEMVLLHTYNYKPDVMIMNDPQSAVWIQEYAYSFAKLILGEARSKFAQITGPQGGTTLNGDALKSEATAEMERLENDLKNYVDGSTPLTWIIG